MAIVSRGVSIVLALVTLWIGSAGAETLLVDYADSPAWAADGASLLCSQCSVPCHDGDSQIWTVLADGSSATALLVDPAGAYSPMWLPGGRQYVYYRMRVDQQTHHEFVVQDLQQGPVRVWEVPDVWDDPGFDLTPDGAEVLYTVESGGGRETRALHLGTGAARTVHEGSGGVISPDGQWIAYFTAQDLLAIAPIDGAPVVTEDVGCCACWTPDSRYIVFTGVGASGSIDLIARSRDGTLRQQLTDDQAQNWYCAISPAGDRIAYSKAAGEFAPRSLWVMDLNIDTTPVKVVTWGRLKATFRDAVR